MCTQPLGDYYGVTLDIPADTEIVASKFLPFHDWTQGRGLLYVQTPTLLFGTAYLESVFDAQRNNGVTQRETQIVQATAFSFCEDRLQQYPSLQIDACFSLAAIMMRMILIMMIMMLMTTKCPCENSANRPFPILPGTRRIPIMVRLDKCRLHQVIILGLPFIFKANIDALNDSY